jgi:hypothetical protein
MSPVLHLDIISRIIDIVGEKEDTRLLKELALVSHSFLPICSKHIFATIELYDNFPYNPIASPKKGFFNLLKSRPDVVKYIRKLSYRTIYYYHLPDPSFDHDLLLAPIILSNFDPTISRLDSLTINVSNSTWNVLESVTPVFLHLMRLPTVNHIELSYFENVPLSIFTLSVNLRRLDILCLPT